MNTSLPALGPNYKLILPKIMIAFTKGGFAQKVIFAGKMLAKSISIPKR